MVRLPGNQNNQMMSNHEQEVDRLKAACAVAESRVQELERRLAAEQGVFRQVFSSAAELLSIKDASSVYLHANPAFCRFVGRREEEVVGRSDTELFPEDEALREQASDREVLTSFGRVVSDVRLTGVAGTTGMLLAKVPFRDADGRIAGVICSGRLEDTLQKSAFEFERFFNMIPDMACIASPEGYLVKLNPAWEKSLGYHPDDLFMADSMVFVHPEDRAVGLKSLELLSKGAESLIFIVRVRASDGSYHSLEWNSSHLSGDRVFGVARDVTERIERERGTRLWADAFRFCTHGLVISLPDTNVILTCNEAFARMHGKSVEEIEGVPIESVYAPDDRERVMKLIGEADRTGSSQYEAIMLRKNGSMFPVQIDVVSIADDTGVLLYRVATVQDITERQNSQIALLESEQRFRSAVESAPDGIFIQTKGCFSYLNQKALELFGATTPMDIIGRPVVDFVHLDFKKVASERIRRLNKELQPVPSLEETMMRVDGTRFEAEVSAVPFVYSGAHGALVFLRDITSRKVAERERAVLEKQLYQSQKIESVGKLAGGVAHDLNNLLTPILGYSEWLALGFTPDDKRSQHLKVIHEAALKARDLVRQLLAFGSSQSLEFRKLELNAIVNGFELLLRRTLRANIEVICRFNDGLLPIQGDAGQLEQIIMNLAINADDSMPNGGRLTIGTWAEVISSGEEQMSTAIPVGHYAVLSVQDTGAGMDNEVLSHVFEPFFTTKPSGKGTGLGLSTVYGIVRQHGGYVRVVSEPGAGTTFRIYFPLLPEAILPVLQPSKSTDKSGNITVTVMVVEDDELVRQFVVQSLLQEGFRVFDTAGGEAAMELLVKKSLRPDLLLTDIVMQGMNGTELFEKAKEMLPGLKVIYMSGYAKEVISDETVPGERVAFLAKPFSVQAMLSKVRGMVNL